MKLLVGVLFLIAAVLVWRLMLPKNGKPRSFVNTSLEVPVVLAIIGAFVVGVVLSIGGVWELVAAKSNA